MKALSYNFNDIVDIWQQRNGKFKFNFRAKEGNIYQTLHLFGYCRTMIGEKYCFCRRKEKKLIITSFVEIKNAFFEYLKECDPATLPKGVTVNDILNAYYKELPIKDNDLFKHYLSKSLIS